MSQLVIIVNDELGNIHNICKFDKAVKTTAVRIYANTQTHV